MILIFNLINHHNIYLILIGHGWGWRGVGVAFKRRIS